MLVGAICRQLRKEGSTGTEESCQPRSWRPCCISSCIPAALSDTLSGLEDGQQEFPNTSVSLGFGFHRTAATRNPNPNPKQSNLRFTSLSSDHQNIN